MSKKKRILFVCMGNIIRSPLAEHMFNHLADQAGVAEKYGTDSAGTTSYHVGEQPDARMRQVAANNGLYYDGRARQFTVADFDAFDLIIAQDTHNLRDLQNLARNPQDEARLYTMRTFDPHGSPEDSVPDPYYGGIEGFQETFNVVKQSCQGLLEALENGKFPG